MVPITLAAVLFAFGGSPSQISDSSNSPPAAQTIIGGEETGEFQYGSIVAILTSQDGLCTGTVIAPRLVITAAHCLANLDPSDEIVVFYGDGLDSNRSTVAIDFAAHPDFCDDCREDIFDYGYVELGADFTPPDGSTLPLTDQEEWDAMMRNGGEVILVGFGEDPQALNPQMSLGKKRAVTTKIRRFSALGLEFFAGGDGRDSCQGDSGGPAIVRLADGTLRLAGITSRGSDPCGEGGFYGTPFPALRWIRDETGVDLLPNDCERGDCLDQSPAAEHDGRCAVVPGSSKPFSILWLFIAPLLAVRRRPL